MKSVLGLHCPSQIKEIRKSERKDEAKKEEGRESFNPDGTYKKDPGERRTTAAEGS